MMSLIVAVVRNSEAPIGAGLTPVLAAGPLDFGAEHAAARSNTVPAAQSHWNVLVVIDTPGYTNCRKAELQKGRIQNRKRTGKRQTRNEKRTTRRRSPFFV